MSRHSNSALRFTFGLASILALAACTDTDTDTSPEPISDHDEDGVDEADGDCDDFNNTIFPGATEIAGDGVDQDCDGEDTPAPPVEDVDGDGVTEAQGDCDDTNSAVHPGARERSQDGVDSNCDGDELPALGEDLFAQVVGLIDTDMDGAISFDEFEVACAAHAMVIGVAEPGVVNTHSTCAGTNACRGMQLHPWGEFFEHDCKGVNTCAGWSCTETAVDQGRDAATLFVEAGCGNCHNGDNGAFIVQVRPGDDVATAVAAFPGLSDERFRASIAFGISGVGPNDAAYQNMPAHYAVMSRAEMNTMIAWLRTAPLQGQNFEYGDAQGPAQP